MGLWASSTCTNELADEDFCSRHMLSEIVISDLIGSGSFRGYDWIVIDVTCQVMVLSVLSYSHRLCVHRLSCSTFCEGPR